MGERLNIPVRCQLPVLLDCSQLGGAAVSGEREGGGGKGRKERKEGERK